MLCGKYCLGVLLALTLCACQNTPPAQAVPAHLSELTPAIKQQLENILTRALAMKVTLSPTALVNSSTLTMAPAPRTTLQNAHSGSRLLGQPVRFTLVIVGEQCVLKQVGRERQWILKAAGCEPLTTTDNRL